MFGHLYQFPEGQIIAFALIFLRMMAFVVAWPVFGTNLVPVPVKILLALIFSILLFPTISFKNVELIKISDEVIFLAIRELVVGLALGFMMRMFFFAVSMMGEMISISSGLASAQVFNPAMGSQSNVMEQFQVTIATLFFLAMNGHHIFLGGLATSFELVPVSAMTLNVKSFASFSLAAQEALLMGLKMSAPILIALFVTNLAMGVLGRAVPQINVLVTSFPVTILICFSVLFIMMPLFMNEMEVLMQMMADHFFKAMRIL